MATDTNMAGSGCTHLAAVLRRDEQRSGELVQAVLIVLQKGAREEGHQGLGLSLCHSICLRHHGRQRVKQRPGNATVHVQRQGHALLPVTASRWHRVCKRRPLHACARQGVGSARSITAEASLDAPVLCSEAVKRTSARTTDATPWGVVSTNHLYSLSTRHTPWMLSRSCTRHTCKGQHSARFSRGGSETLAPPASRQAAHPGPSPRLRHHLEHHAGPSTTPTVPDSSKKCSLHSGLHAAEAASLPAKSAMPRHPQTQCGRAVTPEPAELLGLKGCIEAAAHSCNDLSWIVHCPRRPDELHNPNHH